MGHGYESVAKEFYYNIMRPNAFLYLLDLPCILYIYLSLYCFVYLTSLNLVFCIIRRVFWILYFVSCILYLVYYIIYLVSCILYLVSYILYLVSCILYLVSYIMYLTLCILYLLDLYCNLYLSYNSITLIHCKSQILKFNSVREGVRE